MNVSLTPELVMYITRPVEEGGFRSASEVVRMAVRALQDQEEERQLRLQGLRESTRLLEGPGESEVA